MLRTDGGMEELAGNVEAFLISKQMIRETSAPYSQYQNSVERDVQTVCKGVSAMLHNQLWIRADRWDLALRYFVDCRNASPNTKHAFKSPRQIVTREAIDLERTFIFSFGDIVRVSLPVPDREWKFDVRNDVGIYVGLPDGSVESHIIYWPYTHSLSVRSGVSKLEISDQQLLEWHGRREAMRNGSLPYVVFKIAFFDFCKPTTGGDKEEALGEILYDEGNKTVAASKKHAGEDKACAIPTDRMQATPLQTLSKLSQLLLLMTLSSPPLPLSFVLRILLLLIRR